MTHFRSYGSILLTLAGFVGISVSSCSKEGLPKGTVLERPIMPYVRDVAATKAEDVAALTLLKSEGFSMDIIADEEYEEGEAGQYGGTRNVSWNESESKWEASPVAYWINDTDMSFWAYNNAASENCTINPQAGMSGISFSYPKSGKMYDGQTDLMFAYSSKRHGSEDKHSKGESYDQVDLTFNHALSQICFEKGSTFTGVDGYEISTIEFTSVKDYGEATYDGTVYHWSNQSGSARLEAAFNSVSGKFSTESFLLIPQNPNNVYLQVTLTNGNPSDDLVLNAPLSSAVKRADSSKFTEMLAGTKYTISLNVNNGDYLNLELDIADWDHMARNLEIKDSEIDNNYYINKDSYSGGDIDAANSRIFIHNGMPITGRFKLNSPKGAKLLLALDGNLDAFRVTPKICYIDDNPVDFSIEPVVADPKVDYQTRLHIYLVGADGSVSELDQAIMKEEGDYKHYTIILPAQ